MVNAKELIAKIPEKDLNDLIFISKQIQKSGYESYIIGGSVRDLISNKIPHEYDITTSMRPEEVKNNFKRVIDTGIQHGTVTVMLGDNAYEVTTFRKDIDYTDGRRPDKIEYGNSLSEDMKRRDFTMNAIALDIIHEKAIDENNGLSDIHNKIIRTIGNPLERFGEDGLRPIRAIRFMSTLDFEIEKETYNAIFNTRHVTEKISKERFHDELNKILISKKPFLGLIELYKNKIFELFTSAQINTSINSQSLANVNNLNFQPLGLRLAFLLFCLFPENNLMQSAEQILQDFRYSKLNTKDSLFYLSLFTKTIDLVNINSGDIRKILSKIASYTGKRELDPILEGYLSYLQILYSNELNIIFKTKIVNILTSKDPLVLKELAVNGNDILNKFPLLDKRKMGGILQFILDKILIDPNLNSPEHIFNLIQGEFLNV